jgi:hypothetical protein
VTRVHDRATIRKVAERRCKETGKTVLIYHDERDGLSVMPIGNLKTITIPVYVLEIVKPEDIRRK